MNQGTRFRIFPTIGEDGSDPVTVCLGLPPGTIGPGPADPVMRAIRPVAKTRPYDPPRYVPPYDGLCLPPAMPDANGDFDHIPVDDPSFLSAHMYACVRHTLETWERYLGEPVRWWHAEFMPQLELVSLVDWNNAQSGLGFIEAGWKPNSLGETLLFALSFDVMAHETGHAILFSRLGVPASGMPSAQFLAFHESFSDLISLISLLQLPSVASRLLRQTQGNLYALNMLSRIGELSRTEQIRIADNTDTMADVDGIRLSPTGEWVDLDGRDRNAHALAQPLTGAIFDVLVEVFQDGLDARRTIPEHIDPRGWSRQRIGERIGDLRAASSRSLAAGEADFEWALARARDVVGLAMTDVIATLRPEDISFDRVAACFVASAMRHGQAHIGPDLHEIFALRGISSRGAFVPARPPEWRHLTYAERFARVKAAARNHPPGCGCRTIHPGYLVAARAIGESHDRFRAEAIR